MHDVTKAVLRQRYVLGLPHSHDLTNVDVIPSILRDLAETWRRTMIQRGTNNGPGSPGAVAIGCAEYVESLAELIDAALLAQGEADAARFTTEDE